MEKVEKKQILVITPDNELRFKTEKTGKEYSDYAAEIKLLNPCEKKILFKIKTTAPKKYCVRPNCGIVEPKALVSVKIWVNADVFDPSEKNKHKFMVQSLIAPTENADTADIDQLWKDNPNLLMDTKLRCVFKVPEEKSPKSASSTSGIAAVSEFVTKTKQEPQQASAPPTNLGGGEEPKSDEEVSSILKRVHEQELQLKQENRQLKEEILKFSKESASVPSSAPQYPTNPYSPPPIEANQQTTIMYIGIAIIMTIVGMILGKIIL